MISYRTTVAALGTAAMCFTMSACGDAGVDYGSFRYEAPAGWEQYTPPPGITYADGYFKFYPDVEERLDGPVLELWLMADDLPRERIPQRYVFAQERLAASRSEQVVMMGEAPIAVECAPVNAVIPGPGESHGYEIVTNQAGEEARELVQFIRLPDGRRFRARFQATGPAFREHVEAISTSLSSLQFQPNASAPAPLSRDEVVSVFKEMLRGDRLWIDDGRVRGRVLNDMHLEALTDPAFANVTDLNVDPSSTGVDVTDAGLRNMTHLPLESLCLRGSLVTDAGLAELESLPLKTLVLSGTLIQGEGLRHLSGMEKLMVIDVVGTQVGDEDLVHLKGLPLAQVWVRNSRVTDSGVAELMEYAPTAHVVE